MNHHPTTPNAAPARGTGPDRVPGGRAVDTAVAGANAVADADDARRADALADALDRLAHHGFTDGGGMAHHAPMGAEALSALGYHDQVASWVDTYNQRHDPHGRTRCRPPAHPGRRRRVGRRPRRPLPPRRLDGALRSPAARAAVARRRPCLGAPAAPGLRRRVHPRPPAHGPRRSHDRRGRVHPGGPAGARPSAGLVGGHLHRAARAAGPRRLAHARRGDRWPPASVDAVVARGRRPVRPPARAGRLRRGGRGPRRAPTIPTSRSAS